MSEQEELPIKVRRKPLNKSVNIYLEPDVQEYLEKEGGYSPGTNKLIREHKRLRAWLSEKLSLPADASLESLLYAYCSTGSSNVI